MKISQIKKPLSHADRLEEAVMTIQENYSKAKNGFPNSVSIPKYLHDLMGVVHSIGVSIDHEKEKMRMLL